MRVFSHAPSHVSSARPVAWLAACLVAACGNLAEPSAEQEIRTDFVQIERALALYASANGRFPEALPELASPDPRGRVWLASADCLTDPFGRPYAYVPSRGATPPNIVSLGPDGVPGPDDFDLRALGRY